MLWVIHFHKPGWSAGSSALVGNRADLPNHAASVVRNITKNSSKKLKPPHLSDLQPRLLGFVVLPSALVRFAALALELFLFAPPLCLFPAFFGCRLPTSFLRRLLGFGRLVGRAQSQSSKEVERASGLRC